MQLKDLYDTGVTYLKSLPYVDQSRIGIFGGSFGGFMVLNAMLKPPDVSEKERFFKAGAAFAPVTDWSGYDAIYTERYMSTPIDNEVGYADTSVLSDAGNMNGHLLLIHGADDDNVHLAHSMQLLRALTTADKSTELMVYPGQRTIRRSPMETPRPTIRSAHGILSAASERSGGSGGPRSTHRGRESHDPGQAMTLKAYMVLLATDLDKLSEFVADSRQAAERAGLSRDDQEVLFSGDQNRIYQTVTKQ